MFKTVRAAGFAAAALLVTALAGWGGPLQAGEGAAPVSASSYFDHMSADAGVSDLGLNQDLPAAADAAAEPEAAPAASVAAADAPVAAAVTADQVRFATLADHLVGLASVVLPYRPLSLPELVDAYAGVSTDDRQQDCLASAVYFEARGEPVEGQLAVAEVVMNRAASGRYPPTICDVVTQPWQFSFVNATGRIPAADRSSEAWRKAVAVARIAERGASRLLPRDVLWYHAEYVAPSWGRRLARNTKIGLHIFYS
jgi:hypothetical protein